MIHPHPDDIPVLTEEEKKMPNLKIFTRGWVFLFSYGYLRWYYPG